ncbi:MAG: hypothetical protein WC657_09075, partial [Candidatus Paceibacterota bacterium]
FMVRLNFLFLGNPMSTLIHILIYLERLTPGVNRLCVLLIVLLFVICIEQESSLLSQIPPASTQSVRRLLRLLVRWAG